MRDTSRDCEVERALTAMNLGATLNDATLRKALGLPAIGMNPELADQMREIMGDEEKSEKFAETFFEQINTDDEPTHKIGYYMAKAIHTGSVDDLLIAICGWSAASLVKLAEGEEL